MSGSTFDAECCFHAVQCYIRQQRAYYGALRSSRFGFADFPVFHVAGFKPLFDEFSCGEAFYSVEQELVVNFVECSSDVCDTVPLGVISAIVFAPLTSTPAGTLKRAYVLAAPARFES